jgi:hypothetical protein
LSGMATHCFISARLRIMEIRFNIPSNNTIAMGPCVPVMVLFQRLNSTTLYDSTSQNTAAFKNLFIP